MIARTVGAITASRAAPVVVVTGHEAEKVEAALAGLGAAVVRNPDFARGLSSSLRAGLKALDGKNVSGALVCLGDMPNVTAATLDALIAVFESGGEKDICAPVAEGRRGNPVLWPADLFGEMTMLSGDQGAKDLIARHQARLKTIPAPAAEIFTDVDTPEALAALRGD
ncbi:MAG: nucleotidyltransferase family protein [Alphaproteobacteria bacterium]|nr:nucleotidyltransferase family protein [Alphaproteobacteria bacterium]